MHGDVCIKAGGVCNVGGNAAGSIGHVGLSFCSSENDATRTMATRVVMTIAMMAVHRRMPGNPPSRSAFGGWGKLPLPLTTGGEGGGGGGRRPPAASVGVVP